MNPWIALLSATTAYLFGSISNARNITKIVAPGTNLQKVDLTVEGVGSHRLMTVGATTASVVLGARMGYFIALLDFMKGFIPVLTLHLLYPDQNYHLIAAACATLGHNWPIYHRFKGGGGLSTTLGGFFVVDWLGTLVSMLGGLLLGGFVLRQVAIAFMLGPWLMLAWLSIFKGDGAHILYGISMNVLLTLAVLPDMVEHFKEQRKHKLEIAQHTEILPMFSFMAKFFEPKKRRQGK